MITSDHNFIAAEKDADLDADMAASIAKQAELVRLDGGAAKTLVDIRAQQDRLAPFWNEDAPGIAHVANVTVSGADGELPGRLYRPTDARTPVVIFLHGGGWCRGSVETADCTCRHLAEKTGFAVLSVAYRLAPEHRYPAGLNDVISALEWCRTQGGAFGFDGSRVFLGGGSAGANLSVVASLKCRDEGLAMPAGLILFYGGYQNHDFGTSSHIAYGDGRYGNSTLRKLGYIVNYLPDGVQVTDPYISPMRTPSVAGLPPMWFGIAELDILRDDQLAFAERLTREGGHAVVKRYYGLIHGFAARTRMVPRAVAALGDAAEFIKNIAAR